MRDKAKSTSGRAVATKRGKAPEALAPFAGERGVVEFLKEQTAIASASVQDVNRGVALVQAIGGEIEREIDLLTAFVGRSPARRRDDPERLAEWPTMSEFDRHREAVRYLCRSIESLEALWGDYSAIYAEAAVGGRARRFEAMERDLSSALGLLRERQDHTGKLAAELGEARRRLDAARGESERLERAMASLRQQLNEAQAFNQMLASSTSWKLARALMLPARFLPPVLRRRGRALLQRLLALVRRLRTPRPVAVAPRQEGPGFSRSAAVAPVSASAGGFDVIIALPNGQAPPAEMLKVWREVVGTKGKIVVCAPAPSNPGLDVVYVPAADAENPTAHIDALIRSAASPTVIVVTDADVVGGEGLEAFASVFASRPRVVAGCAVSIDAAGVIGSAGFDLDESGRYVPAGQGQGADGSRWSFIRRIDALAPPVVAFDVDAYVHLGGLPVNAGGYVEALAAFSRTAAECAFEVVCNPFARIEGRGEAIAAPSRQPELKKAPARKKALFVEAAAPTPDRDSGSLDLVWYIRIFQDLGYDVTFLPTLKRQVDAEVQALRRMGVEVPLAADVEEPWQLLRDRGGEFEVALLSRVTVACHLIDPVRTFAPKTRIIFDTVDLHFLREEREAALNGSEEATAQAQRTRVEELRVMGMADVTIVRSQIEAALLAEIAPSVRTRIVPIVRPVEGRLAPAAGRRDMMFVGGFLHQPNLDAVAYLHDEIWPKIRAQAPDARLHVIGANAPAEVTRLHDPAKGFLIQGYVADLDEYYRSIRVNLAPLRYGAGLKGKLVASLAKGLPSVATAVAAEGMGLEHEATAMLAADPQAFADAAVRLYTDDWLWERISDRGLAYAENRFSVSAVRSDFESLISELQPL